LFTVGFCAVLLVVNNFLFAIEKGFVPLVGSAYSQTVHRRLFVNKCVDINSLSDGKVVLGWPQFIERTESNGGGQQIDAGLLKDNPRQLGNS
jgi:hypothetical protein